MKKILIFNGAVKKQGDTAQLIQSLCEKLPSQQVSVVDCHDPNLSPCVDCRWCWTHPGCALQDGMQPIYQQIQEADWIILASPVHFDEISGTLMQAMSRLQVYCMARMQRKEELLAEKKRRGAALLVAGGPGKAEPAQRMMKVLLHCMHAGDDCLIHCKGTDRQSVAENGEVQQQIQALADWILREDKEA